VNLAYRTFGEFLERLRHDRIEDADELLQIDLAVVVRVPEGEQGVDLLAVEVLRGAHLVPADFSVPVRVDQSKSGLDKEVKRDKLNLLQPLFYTGNMFQNLFTVRKRKKYINIKNQKHECIIFGVCGFDMQPIWDDSCSS
jgi:hypothetical protein